MKPLAAILLAGLGLASPSFAQTRVHCGGPAYTDSKGNVWQADTDFSGGAAYSQPVTTINGTSDPQLFGSIRYAIPGSSFTYTIPVPNGAYNVNLSFAELWSTNRDFTIKVNGTAALLHFNPLAKAGEATADIETIPVTVTTGSIAIELDAFTGNGYIDAIEILPVGPPPQSVNLTVSGNLSFDDGTPVTGNVQITQVTILPGGGSNNNVLGNFTPDASGNISGTISLSTNFQDQCTFNFYLFDATGKQVGFMQTQIPGVTFNLVHSIAGFKIVVLKASCASICTLGPGSTMGTLGS